MDTPSARQAATPGALPLLFVRESTPPPSPQNHNAIAYLGKVAYTVSVGLVYFIMGIMRLEMDDEENGQISYFKN